VQAQSSSRWPERHRCDALAVAWQHAQPATRDTGDERNSAAKIAVRRRGRWHDARRSMRAWPALRLGLGQGVNRTVRVFVSSLVNPYIMHSLHKSVGNVSGCAALLCIATGEKGCGIAGLPVAAGGSAL